MLASATVAAAVGVLVDPLAVAAAHAAGEGADLVHPLGACFTSVYGAPVTVPLRVARLLEGMVVLRTGRTAIVLAERPTRADPALFAAAGIDLQTLQLLAVKGGEAARLAFAPTFPVALAAGCAGPTSNDLARLPFNSIPAARRTPGAAERYASDQEQRAEQAEQRDENRRPHAKQQRAQALGTQRPKLRVQP